MKPPIIGPITGPIKGANVYTDMGAPTFDLSNISAIVPPPTLFVHYNPIQCGISSHFNYTNLMIHILVIYMIALTFSKI